MSRAEKFDMIAKQIPLEDGIHVEDAVFMYDYLKGDEALPFSAEANNTAAVGFISLEKADELDFNLSVLVDSVAEIIGDKELESNDNTYNLVIEKKDGTVVYVTYKLYY